MTGYSVPHGAYCFSHTIIKKTDNSPLMNPGRYGMPENKRTHIVPYEKNIVILHQTLINTNLLW